MPESFVQDLLECCFVALALVLGSHEQDRAAAGVKADLGEFETGRRGALDRKGNTDAAQFALLKRMGASRLEAREIGVGERRLHDFGERAAIIGDAERVLVRHRRGRDQVAAAQVDWVATQFARCIVDQPLDDVDRLAAPPAPR